MAASYDTIDKIYRILRTHLSCVQLNAFIIDLTTVPGNKSFRDTVERLQNLHKETRKQRACPKEDD